MTMSPQNKTGKFYGRVLLAWVAMILLLFVCNFLYNQFPFLQKSSVEKQMIPFAFLPSLVVAILIVSLILFVRPGGQFTRKDLWITGLFWMIATTTFGVFAGNFLPDDSRTFFLLHAILASRGWFVLLGAMFLLPPVAGSRYLKKT